MNRDPVPAFAEAMGIETSRQGGVLAVDGRSAARIIEAAQSRGMNLLGIDVFRRDPAGTLVATDDVADYSRTQAVPPERTSNLTARAGLDFLRKFGPDAALRYELTFEDLDVDVGFARKEASTFAKRLETLDFQASPWMPVAGWSEGHRLTLTGRAFDVQLECDFRTDDDFENWQWLAGFASEAFWTVPAAWRLWLEGKRWNTGHLMAEESEWLLAQVPALEAKVAATGRATSVTQLAEIYEALRLR